MTNAERNEIAVQIIAKQLETDPRVVVRVQIYKERKYGEPLTRTWLGWSVAHGRRGKWYGGARTRHPRESVTLTTTTRAPQVRSTREGYVAQLGRWSGFGTTRAAAVRALAELLS